MNDHNNIRRALANEGLELPADQPVPSRLIDDIYAHTEIEGAMPLSDPASNAIAAHTTPGKGERFGCRIVQRPDRDYDVESPCGKLDLWSDDWVLVLPHSRDVGYFGTEESARAALAKAPPPPGWVEANTASASTDLTDAEWSKLLATIEEYRTASGVLGIVLSRQLRCQIDMLLLRRAYGKGGA